MSQPDNTTVPPRAFAFFSKQLTAPTLALFGAMLTIHGQIVKVLSGTDGIDLNKHVSLILIGIMREAEGLNAKQTERANEKHAERGVFADYPHAASYVINALAAAIYRQLPQHAEPTGGEPSHVLDVTSEQIVELEAALNHLAQRYNVPAGNQTFDQRLLTYEAEIRQLIATEQLLGAAGAAAFGTIVSSAPILRTLGINKITPEIINVILRMMGHLPPPIRQEYALVVVGLQQQLFGNAGPGEDNIPGLGIYPSN